MSEFPCGGCWEPLAACICGEKKNMTTQNLEQQARHVEVLRHMLHPLLGSHWPGETIQREALEFAIAALTSAQGNAEFVPMRGSSTTFALSEPVPVADGDRVGPCFADAEALATWLESLHECNDDGAVTGDKWEPAQKAAAAIRTQTLPVNVHGTWIDVPIRVQLYIVNLLEKLKASPATTEVEGEAVLWLRMTPDGKPDWSEDCVAPDSIFLDDDMARDGYYVIPLYTHPAAQVKQGANEIHSCSLYCERPACVRAQRDQMREHNDTAAAIRRIVEAVRGAR